MLEETNLADHLASKKMRRRYFLIGALVGALISAGVVVTASLNNDSGDLEGYGDSGAEEAACNVMGINLHGDVVTYAVPAESGAENGGQQDQTASEDVVLAIRDADKDPQIKAILLEVESYGGYPVAGEEIAVALRSASKPTIAFIRQTGASGAYLAATGAKIIFASKYSDVGGIGITMSYVDNTLKNQKEGLTYNVLSTGRFKDTGSPNKPLTAEERALLMRDLEIAHRDFVEDVAANRGLEISAVEKLADGSTMPGEMVLEKGLIDRIGGMPEVEAYLAEKIGEKVVVCW
ncbi:MAG: S49 family peptidase [bacterium]|nr:S49 family peptidase [bacterium]